MIPSKDKRKYFIGALIEKYFRENVGQEKINVKKGREYDITNKKRCLRS